MTDLPAKESVRKRIREKRCALSAAWLEERSAAATSRALALPEFTNADTVGCYMSTAGEVVTKRIFEESWSQGKRVLVPAWDPEEKQYHMAFLPDDAPLATGPFGIQEPDEKTWHATADAQVIFVPGVAFDRHGVRVGHGRGYYDRILGKQSGTAPCCAALAFEFQVYAHLPAESWDVPMDLVITDKEIIRMNKEPAAVDSA